MPTIEAPRIDDLAERFIGSGLLAIRLWRRVDPDIDRATLRRKLSELLDTRLFDLADRISPGSGWERPAEFHRLLVEVAEAKRTAMDCLLAE